MTGWGSISLFYIHGKHQIFYKRLLWVASCQTDRQFIYLYCRLASAAEIRWWGDCVESGDVEYRE